MTTVAESALTREGLIWRIVECVSKAEGKDFTRAGNERQADRDYMLSLVLETTHAVDGKRSLR